MSLDWKAFTVFSGRDEISAAVKGAQKNTEAASGKMGDAVEGTGKKLTG